MRRTGHIRSMIGTAAGKALVTMVAVTVFSTGALHAQGAHTVAGPQHIADAAVLREAIASQTAADIANRDVVFQALNQPEARQLADRMGLDLRDARSVVDQLTTEQVAELAKITGTDRNLAGGAQTVVISVTTLLLLLILLVLIAK